MPPHQGTDAGAIDGRDVGEIDHQVSVAVPHQSLELLLESLGRAPAHERFSW
jgi:hypothetical protein